MEATNAMRTAGTIAAGAEEVTTRTFRFRKNAAGRLPGGWTIPKTGTNEGSNWRVVPNGSAPSGTGFVLVQLTDSPRGAFNVCIADDAKFRDLEVSVCFMPIRGRYDRGGGLIWRYQDRGNYYLAGIDALEGNCRIDKVVNGERYQVAIHAEPSLRIGHWHTLTIEHECEHIQCFLDGQKCLEFDDTTFMAAGRIGIWTRSDAHTYFDDLTAHPLSPACLSG
jgi:hypothetical protein